jgi:hypothetical protein
MIVRLTGMLEWQADGLWLGEIRVLPGTLVYRADRTGVSAGILTLVLRLWVEWLEYNKPVSATARCTAVYILAGKGRDGPYHRRVLANCIGHKLRIL